RDARALELKKVGAAQALSAQTVTTTTVTTTTVTTYPPLRLPRVRQHKVLAPEMYPLAAAPAPPALERFAVDINGQNLYFSQRGFGGYQTGEEILASIAANNAVADNAAPTARQPVAASAAFVPPEHLQRAMTPLYTQDDEDAAMAAAAAAAAVGGEPSPLLEQFAYTAPVRHAPRPELPAAAARLALGSRSRRSSSPPSPTHHRQFGRCSPSPTAARRRQLLDTAPGSTSGSSSADEHSDDDFAVASQGPATAVAAVDAINTADDAAVLPLPSPLLSPRARPEPMDTDDALDRPGAQTTTTTHTDVTHGHMSRAMAAVYDMPDMVAAYDSLPPTMQTYLLYQLLRRTPRPALQFAAQAVVPVLQRDFLGELPVEVAHHVLRFM
ncbi:SCF ubiquitin ligase complex subunit cdc4, partial [Coemansia spiralis]